jgi:hypothetical protein
MQYMQYMPESWGCTASAWCSQRGVTLVSGLMTKQLLGLICRNLSEEHAKNMGLCGESVGAFSVVSHW